MPSRAGFWSYFGPGILWAATAIGVSHLVQSTRAGALAGLGLCGVVLVALVLKYPFFEYGARYAAATGESLIEGYHRVGRWALWLYIAITIGTAGVVQSVVVLFASYVLRFALGLSTPLPLVAAVLMSAVIALFAAGRFRALDVATKVLVGLLTISTLIAAVGATPRLDWTSLEPVSGLRTVSFGFVLALVGWMPSGLDLAAWSSLWTLAKREDGTRASVRMARLDFNIGYIGTSVLAFAFVILGAGVMHGSGREFSPSGTIFATQLIELYTETLGEWTRPFVLIAVTTTILSTAVTVMDGFPRALDRAVQNLRDASLIDVGVARPTDPGAPRTVYWISIAALFAVTEAVLVGFIGNITAMVDFATILSFLTAPVVGWLTLRAVTSPTMPAEHRPGRAMLALSWFGLLLLGGTGLIWLF